ncbi:MAG: UDP-2,3-diacylglucosamine diphosphatase [Arcobacteraceae bacterium]|jgi:UDP-2,3-diacylglucosamine hydrolase|nr:UDP-2,3-diacylglucosamine diphosphatase [Arcobacteraceae bacterium]MDY0364339.1 UDP-2,3-diacylglucosamine diphosphatase [Arcobacteraceae bacterium]
MYHNTTLNIKENAIFIADSHYNKNKTELVDILTQILENKISTTQLFLMGDIFDFLSSESSYFINLNQNIIDLINSISQNIEVFYFEGNHDFNLQTLFPNVLIFDRKSQPVAFMLKDKKAYLSHGDIYTPFTYNLYSKIIRNSCVLRFLNFIDINNFISKFIERSLSQKDICKELSNFDLKAKNRVLLYPECDIIIEGHFHQNYQISYNNKLYVNLPSAYCSKSYAKINTKTTTIDTVRI